MEYTVITGASSGIGKALSAYYAKEGKDLILIARREALLEEMKHELEEQYKTNIEVISYDLTLDLKDLQEKLDSYSIDSVILNAGFGISGEFHTHNIEREIEMIQLNIESVVSLSHYFSNRMRLNSKGQITVISSVASMIPGPFMATYYASKAYVSSFSYSISHELKPYHIYVTCCNMPRIDTDFDRVAGERHSKFIKKGKDASWAAKKIAHVIKRKKRIANIGFSTKVTSIASKLLPKVFFLWLMAKVNR